MFEIAWTLHFGARSGGSPTIANGVIYFDSDYPETGMGSGFDDDEEMIDPHFYGVVDHGFYGEYAFKAPLADNIRGSSPVDPLGRRMGILTGEEELYLISPEGVVDYPQTILLSDYPKFRATHFSGIVTFGWAADTGNPVAFCNVMNWERLNEFYVAAINIVTKELLS